MYELNSQSVVESKIPYEYVWNRQFLLLALFPAQPALFFVLVLFYHLPCCTWRISTSFFEFVCLALYLLKVVALVWLCLRLFYCHEWISCSHQLPFCLPFCLTAERLLSLFCPELALFLHFWHVLPTSGRVSWIPSADHWWLDGPRDRATLRPDFGRSWCPLFFCKVW